MELRTFSVSWIIDEALDYLIVAIRMHSIFFSDIIKMVPFMSGDVTPRKTLLPSA
jgi:hypothetical protein